MPDPEALAREEIDRQLALAGWIVQDRKALNLFAGEGVAIREVSIPGAGETDYLLVAGGRALGIVEAKPVGATLKGVEIQTQGYAQSLPGHIPVWRLPLPMLYESTGKETQFTNLLEPEPRSRRVFAFHRPDTLKKWAQQAAGVAAGNPNGPGIGEDRADYDTGTAALAGRFQCLPETIDDPNLWPAQRTAIANIERSLKANKPRALVQMATGSGKTFTAISLIYRLIRHADAKRVLFLVDRANLGAQTFKEFQQYTTPDDGRKFTELYNVQHLRSNRIDDVSRVCISTIQRVYSILSGAEELDEELEEGSLFEVADRAAPPKLVSYNPAVPIETFDIIVIDEAHRSIFNLWRQVLEYFDAPLIGLTATPSKHTIGFFKSNLVTEYNHAAAVADGVNVGYEVYRIRTKVTEDGATLEKDPAYLVPRRDRRTRRKRYSALDEDLTYTANRLDRDVVNQAQIRLVVRTFRERLFTEIFPGRTEVPKTLVFAKDDSHADDITGIIREEFGKGNEFCQKITYRTTGKKPEELLQEFRNDYHPRIAVSVDMIATGTDVKPLECLLFMRNVKSANYFEQMKGRGSRVIGTDDLKGVTPDADAKTRFVIVDAVGLTEHDKTETQPLDRRRSVPVERLMQSVAEGSTDPDVVSTLAARLAVLDLRLGEEESNCCEGSGV